MFIDGGWQFLALRLGLVDPLQRLDVDFHPFREAALLRSFQRTLDAPLLFGMLGNFHHIAWFDLVRRDVNATTIHFNTVVTHYLARLGPGSAKTHTIEIGRAHV